MKSIKDIRVNLESLSENLESSDDVRKLTTLVRAGLFDANKLTMLKRALRKDNTKMTKAEKDALIQLLDKLLDTVMSSQGTFMKVKQSVVHEEIEPPTEEEILESSKYEYNRDPRIAPEKVKNVNIDINQIPSIIMIKRRAIRVFPDGQKVALYWADKIGKYISIPFQSIGLSEDVEDIDQVSLRKKTIYKSRMERQHKSNPTPQSAAALSTASSKLDKEKKRLSKKYKNKDPQGVKQVQKSTDDLIQQRQAAVKKRVQSSYDKKKETYKKELDNRGGGFGKDFSDLSGHGIAGALGGALGMMGHRAMAGKLEKPVKPKILKESTAKLKFKKKISEVRQYGAADAALDAASFIPGPAGSAASLASAGMDISRGDYWSAALDAAGAVPILGYAAKAAKLAKVAKAAKLAKAGSEAGKVAKAGGEVEKVAKVGGEVEKVAKVGGEVETAANKVSPPKRDTLDVASKKETPKQEPVKKQEPVAKPEEPATSTGAKKERDVLDVGTKKPVKPVKQKNNRMKWLKAGKFAAGLGAGLGAAASNLAKNAKQERPDSTAKFKGDVKTMLPGQDSMGAKSAESERLNRVNTRFLYGDRKAVSENRIDTLRSINETTSFVFDDGSVDVSKVMASKILEVYDNLNFKNKKMFTEMINKDRKNFIKATRFALTNKV